MEASQRMVKTGRKVIGAASGTRSRETHAHLTRDGIQNCGLDTEEGYGGGTGLGLDSAREGRNDDAACLRLPVRSHESQHCGKLNARHFTDQNVSTMAHCRLPTCSLYQFHASGLMGSPTLPRTRNVERSCPVTWCSPSLLRSLDSERVSIFAFD
jgi:hypothetical protein